MNREHLPHTAPGASLTAARVPTSGLAALSWLLALTACTPRAAPPAPRARAADAGRATDPLAPRWRAGDACRLPELTLGGPSADAPPPACFPRDFQPTRVRVRDGRIELCGLAGSPRPRPRCYAIRPLENQTEEIGTSDAPTRPTSTPAVEEPLALGTLSARGARVSTRNGTLEVSGRSGNHRSAVARSVAFTTLENAALAPWSDGCHVVMVGYRGADLGAVTVIDPGSLRIIGHAARLPCEGP